jgi:thioredoxin-dependent peroxiredoxin
MKKLQRGDTAINFEAPDLLGQRFWLSELTRGGVWLAFYRYSSCPMCNMHFDDVVSRKNLLRENGVEFVAVFESYKENFPKRYLNMEIKGITMVADPAGKLYETYGVEKNWSGYLSPKPFVERAKAGVKGYMEGKIDGPLDRIPAHFLILPNGKIFTAHYGKNIADNLKWRSLEEYFQALKVSTPPPDSKNEITFVNDGLAFQQKDEKTVRLQTNGE